MPERIEQKWRPPLLMVLGGSLLAVLVLPIWGLWFVDLMTPSTGRRTATTIVATGALTATLILGWLLWRLILGPVRALAARAKEIRAGGTARSLPHYGTPEIESLAQVVLDMAQVLQARELAVRGYTDHVTHELKTPLSAIRGAAELLESEPSLAEEAKGLVATIRMSERRAERLMAAARQIAAARSPDHQGSTTLANALPDLRSRVPGLIIEAEGEDVALPLALSGLSIVLVHLAENADEAGASRLTLAAEKIGDDVTLTVSDDGPGISEGNATKAFEPFFTTRRDSGGTGMGLSIAQTLMLAHGGRIVLEPDGPGARFRIEF